VSLGLPAHLAPQVVRRSFVRAQHTFALTLLFIMFFLVLVLQSAHVEDSFWPAAIALTPMMALLVLRGRERTVLWAAGYLIVGGIGVYWHASILLSQPQPVVDGDGFSFILVKVALMMVGGTGIGLLSGLAWTAAGYLVAEVSIGLAQLGSGQAFHFDVASFTVVLGTLGVLPLINLISHRQLSAQPRLHRAVRDEQLAALRYRVEVKAAALMHDTVLNHLAAIADSSGEALSPELREQIRRDVESLVGEEWLAEPPASDNARSRLDWQHSGLFTAIQEGRLLGLDVEATGDLLAVGRLERGTSITLGLAVKQCLVNVLKHSGTTHAEVAVYASESELSVMVVDNGSGFTEAATGNDRLGLRTSVRKRIEAVDGSVNVWSTPGRGTSIMIRVPMGTPIPSASGGGNAG
jgi:Signal transduction histidine kinase